MIPVNERLLAEEDFTALQDTSAPAGFHRQASTSTSSAAYCCVGHGIAVSNGTTALQVAVEAVGVGAGNEVIMPNFTIISYASTVVRVGGKPVLVGPRAGNQCENDTFRLAEPLTAP